MSRDSSQWKIRTGKKGAFSTGGQRVQASQSVVFKTRKKISSAVDRVHASCAGAEGPGGMQVRERCRADSGIGAWLARRWRADGDGGIDAQSPSSGLLRFVDRRSMRRRSPTSQSHRAMQFPGSAKSGSSSCFLLLPGDRLGGMPCGVCRLHGGGVQMVVMGQDGARLPPRTYSVSTVAACAYGFDG